MIMRASELRGLRNFSHVWFITIPVAAITPHREINNGRLNRLSISVNPHFFSCVVPAVIMVGSYPLIKLKINANHSTKVRGCGPLSPSGFSSLHLKYGSIQYFNISVNRLLVKDMNESLTSGKSLSP